MPVFTVHEPPRRAGDSLGHAARFVFLRDGFHWTAFLFTPLWMLRHRLWLELAFFLVIVTALVAGLQRFGGGEGFGLLSALLVQLFVGMEAFSLRRWKLSRRGFLNLGIVIGDDREAAERRFFEGWIAEQGPPPAASAVSRMAAVAPEVVGLFPRPGGRS